MLFHRAGSLLVAVGIAFSVTASELDITPAVLTNGDYATLFHRVITVTGGTPPYTALTVTDFEANGTGVAAPVIDLAAGTITFESMPTNDGTVVFTAAVTDSTGATTERDYEVLINYELGFNPPFVVGETAVGFGLGVYTEIANGTPPYTSLEVLDFDAGGTGAEAPVANLAGGSVSGNSTVYSDGIATFRLRATDSAGGVAEQDFSAIVDSTLHFMPKTLPPGDAGATYGQVLHVAGLAGCCQDVSVTSFDDGGTGLAPPTASTVAGTITFGSTPIAAGTATVGVHVTDTPGGTFNATYSITIHPAVAISPPMLPEGTVGDPFDYVVTVSGGVPPYKLIRLHGYLPAASGIPTPTINRATGTITFDGTPTAASVINFDVTAYDSLNGTAFQEFTFIVARPLSVLPETLPDGINGQPYYQAITIDGGSLPYTTFAVNAFNGGGTGLAPPVVDASAGTIIFNSTPASAGTVSFTIDVVDSFGRTLAQNASIVIQPMSAPTGIAATANAPDSVLVTWNASAGASVYEVERSSDGIAYSVIGSTISLAVSDTSVAANTAYLYRVRVVSPALSPYTAPDLATATVFTDPALPMMPIRAVHFTELRTSVNSVRTLAGLAAITFAHSPVIQAVHLTQLRSALAAARTALGLPPLTFAQPSISPSVTKVLAVDVEELRNGVN